MLNVVKKVIYVNVLLLHDIARYIYVTLGSGNLAEKIVCLLLGHKYLGDDMKDVNGLQGVNGLHGHDHNNK